MSSKSCGNSGYMAIYSQAGTNLKFSGRQFLLNSTHKAVAIVLFYKIIKHIYIHINNNESNWRQVISFTKSVNKKVESQLTASCRQVIFLHNPPTKMKNLS